MKTINLIAIGILLGLAALYYLIVANVAFGTTPTNGAKLIKCQIYDQVVFNWGLEQKFNVYGRDVMDRNVDGQKIQHFRRKMVRTDLTLFVYFMDVKDTEKIEEYGKLFKKVENCSYKANTYTIFVEAVNSKAGIMQDDSGMKI